MINFGKTSFLNSTIAFNTEAGLESDGDIGPMTNTIVAENNTESKAGVDCIGYRASSDHSLDSDGTCGCRHPEQSNPRPGRRPLNNGGSTPVLSLNPEARRSTPDKSSCLATDQRGAPRPGITGDVCDLGADEYDNAPPQLTVPSNISKEAENSKAQLSPTKRPPWA